MVLIIIHEMIYQLPNGSSIEISTEQYFNMSDAELDYLNSSHYGDYIENPFHGSVLGRQIPDDIEEEILEDLISATDEDKLLDLDTDLDLLDI